MPYNPQIQYRGDQYLFQGISQAGQDIAKAITRFRDERNESQFLDQAASTMAPLLLRHQDKLNEEQRKELVDGGIAGLSLNKKRGAVAKMGFLIQQFDQQAAQEQAAKEASNMAAYRRDILGLQQGQFGLQQKAAQEAQSMRDKLAKFNTGVNEFMNTPRMVGLQTPYGSVPAIPPSLTKADLARLMTSAGLATPESLAPLVPKDQFQPTAGEVGGVQYITTSPNSAMPVTQRGATGTVTPLEAVRQVNALTRAKTELGALGSPEVMQDIEDRIQALTPFLPEGYAPGKEAAVKPSSQKFTKGQVVRQNGKTYVYDGKEFQPQ